ncbi:hypothetical protein ACGK9R_06775 [Halomonas sp. HNIBRBA4712]|uniref:hypothetical protein n=1 Tax=Halomonas sp. HNIBRBA4712 TaxID=3373087 RepID=UPI003744E51C
MASGPITICPSRYKRPTSGSLLITPRKTAQGLYSNNIISTAASLLRGAACRLTP